MVGSETGSGSGKFDRIRDKSPDPTESGSATLLMSVINDLEQLSFLLEQT